MISNNRDSKEKTDAATSDALSKLWEEFDRELAYLREPGAGAELCRLFKATPEELAHAANAAARVDRGKH